MWQVKIKTVEDSFDKSNEEFTELFISAKRVEGCSLKTLRYYLATINKMTNTVCWTVLVQWDDGNSM